MFLKEVVMNCFLFSGLNRNSLKKSMLITVSMLFCVVMFEGVSSAARPTKAQTMKAAKKYVEKKLKVRVKKVEDKNMGSMGLTHTDETHEKYIKRGVKVPYDLLESRIFMTTLPEKGVYYKIEGVMYYTRPVGSRKENWRPWFYKIRKKTMVGGKAVNSEELKKMLIASIDASSKIPDYDYSVRRKSPAKQKEYSQARKRAYESGNPHKIYGIIDIEIIPDSLKQADQNHLKFDFRLTQFEKSGSNLREIRYTKTAFFEKVKGRWEKQKTFRRRKKKQISKVKYSRDQLAQMPNLKKSGFAAINKRP
jgi:hypothetical protein